MVSKYYLFEIVGYMELMTRKGNQKSFNCVTYNYADLFHICHVITISLLRLLGRCYFGDAENVEKKHHKKKTLTLAFLSLSASQAASTEAS